MDNLNSSSPQNISSIPPLLPPTLFEELSLFIQRMPAWVFASLSLMSIFVLYQFVGGLITFLLFGMTINESNVAVVRLSTMFGQILFLLVPTVILAKLRFPHVRNVFRFGGINVLEIVLVIIAVFTLQQLLQGYLMMQESLPIHFPPIVEKFIDQMKEMMEEMYRMLTSAHSIPEFLFVVIVIAVTPAVCEELLFRGLIQRTLEEPDPNTIALPTEQRRRGLIAAIIAGVIFGLYHLNPFTFIPLTVLGVYFGFVVYRTHNIITSVAAHFFNNFLACLAVYLQLDDNFLAVSPLGQPDTIMYAVNYVLCAVVFVTATYYLVRITNRLPNRQAGTDVPPAE